MLAVFTLLFARTHIADLRAKHDALLASCLDLRAKHDALRKDVDELRAKLARPGAEA